MTERTNTAQETPERIRVLYIAPMEKPKLMTIDHTLEKLQELVGGYIDVMYPWPESDKVGVIVNDEGKVNGSMPNRCLEDYDVIFGPFVIAGLTETDFGSLSDELAEKYFTKFAHPEMFFTSADNKVMCIKIGSTELPRIVCS